MEELSYLPILMYHHVIEKGRAVSWNNFCVEPDIFTQQMEYLKREGYTSLDFEDLENIIDSEAKCPAKPVMITFDDAYSETAEKSIGILAERSLKCVFSVVTGYMGKKSGWEKENPGYSVLSETEIRGYSGPLVTFESHSANHVDLTKIDGAQLKSEMSGSRSRLESVTQKKVRTVVYPYGAFDDKVKNAAKEAGYRFGLAIAGTKKTVAEDLLEIRRVYIKSSDSMSDFKRKISRWYLWFRGIKEAGKAKRTGAKP